MSEDGLHPWETILRLCEAAAPEPWYPHLFAKQEGVDPKDLDSGLEEMCLSGLIERVEGDPERGPAISLTREGQRVLLDPAALQRLRADQPISSQDRAGVIRQARQGRLWPYITYLLLLLNLAVFAADYYAANKIGEGSAFLQGTQLTVPMIEILKKSGAIAPEHVIEGQWWRLLTATFVHIGGLNLLMHLICLFFIGRFIEQMWGHVHYLVIFLMSVIGASCLGVAHSPKVVLLAGATGAICGLLAAEAVWLLFNRRYLPHTLRRRARRILLTNFILLVFITSYKNVSAWGDVGAIAAGATTALLLQLHRFGPPMWRWLALTGFVPLVWYGPYAIERARLTNPQWQDVEETYLENRLGPEVNRTIKAARAVYQKQVEPILERHPTRRDPDRVAAALPILDQQQHELNTVAERLDRTGPFVSPGAEEARQAGHDYVQAMAEWFAGIEHMMRIGEKRTDKDRQALLRQEQEVDKKEREWKELLK